MSTSNPANTNQTHGSAGLEPLIRLLAQILVEQAMKEGAVAEQPAKSHNLDTCEH